MDNNVYKKLEPHTIELLLELQQYGMIFQDEYHFILGISPISSKSKEITAFLNKANKDNDSGMEAIVGGAVWPDDFYYWYDTENEKFPDANSAQEYAKKVMKWIRDKDPNDQGKGKSFIQLYEQNNY